MQNPADDTLPEAVVDSHRRVSLVWLIPLVAVIAAAWLGYHSYTQQGPLVSISFHTAEGLQAGKTRVRFKDVDIGLVEAIEFAPDLSRIRVRARLSTQVEAYLNDNARFWVVRPRLSGSEVSGLETLVGGTYIGADLTHEGTSRRSFEGLEKPPIVSASEPGKSFTLHAESLRSLSIGSPVLFRGIEVGRVVAYGLEPAHGVAIQIFVAEPYADMIDSDTRFWNASGVELSLDARGLRLDANSLTSVLLGGIAFASLPGKAPGAAVADNAGFLLFPDRESAMQQTSAPRDEWLLAFSGSVRGLAPGAPVEFRGIRVGEVTDVRLDLDAANHVARIPVTIAIEPHLLDTGNAVKADPAQRRELWDALVGDGLRAQLKTANLITGALFVDLDFYPLDEPREIMWSGEMPELPTVPTALDELRTALSRLSKLPLEQIGEDLRGSLQALGDTMQATNALLQRLDRETASELSKTLDQTRSTLLSVERFLKPNSPLQTEAHRALREFGSAARSLRIMADYLERHPEALLRGKGAPQP